MMTDTTESGAAPRITPARTAEENLLDATGRLDGDAVARAHKEWHARRIARGLVATDTQWFRPFADEWMRSIDTGNPTLTPQAILRVAAGLREGLAVRDAMLVSILLPRVDATLMLQLAADPHGRNSVDAVEEALNAMFHNPSVHPEPRRCAAGLGMLGLMHRTFPGTRENAQVMAVTAYTCWWMGLIDEAREGARAALADDPECTLATIILTGVEFHMPPAWADPEKHKREREEATR